MEKKRQELLCRYRRHHDRSVLPLRLTNFSKSQSQGSPPILVMVRHCRWGGVPGRSCSKSVHSGGCGAPDTAAPEGEPFRTLDSTNILWVIAGFCTPAWARHCWVFWQGRDGPKIGTFSSTGPTRWPVTDIDICGQSQIVKTARERLVMALRADRLAKNVLEN